MTKRTPAFSRAFAGRWRIAEMDQWEDIDLLGAAHIASGRGWAVLGTAGRLVGHLFIHKGDDSGFVAERDSFNSR